MYEYINYLFNVWVYAFKALSRAPTNVISNAFLWLMALLFLWGLVHILARWSWLKKVVDVLPSVLVTLGVLGTFIGIAIGLATFDADMLVESVKKLLDGLKLSFATSIAGLSGSMILRVTKTVMLAVFDTDDEKVGITNLKNLNVSINDISLKGYYKIVPILLANIKYDTQMLSKTIRNIDINLKHLKDIDEKVNKIEPLIESINDKIINISNNISHLREIDLGKQDIDKIKMNRK